MRVLLRIGVPTLLLLVLWTAAVLLATAEGWWRRPLASGGDPRAFMDAAIELVDSAHSGNGVFALIEGGSVYDEHAASVGEPGHRRPTIASPPSLRRHSTPRCRT